MTITLTKDGLPQLHKQMARLTRDRVLVGVPAEETSRKPEPGEPVALTNAEIAYIHDKGAPEANIPARPFMEPGVMNARDAIVKQMGLGAKRALSGDPEAADKALNSVGLAAQSAIQNKITDGPFVPLKPRTLAERKARGRTGTKPLIDTGQLRRSINYVIREKS